MRWPDHLARRPRLPEGGWPAQRVLITGASGGIGQALVDELAAAEALEAAVARHPGRVTALPADLTRAEQRARLVAAAEQTSISMLINAAGVNRVALFSEGSDAELKRLVALNLTATLQLTRALLPQLMAARQGWVVTLGSTFGTLGYP